MVDVFISYSRDNKDRVATIAQAVEAAGYDVWWDAELPPHRSYGDVITEKIGMAKAAIVVWSQSSAQSEWVRAEADVARNQKKLVQTAIDDVMPPLPFNQIQFAELADWQGEPDHRGWRKVLMSLEELCGRAAAAAPPIAAPA
ncbi:MAG: toll/interleukin-1 receptor domain-containing protein, partial [Sphingopyxis sp.]